MDAEAFSASALPMQAGRAETAGPRCETCARCPREEPKAGPTWCWYYSGTWCPRYVYRNELAEGQVDNGPHPRVRTHEWHPMSEKQKANREQMRERSAKRAERRGQMRGVVQARISDGKLIAAFTTSSEAGKALDMPSRTVQDCCNNRRVPRGRDWTLRWQDEYDRDEVAGCAERRRGRGNAGAKAPEPAAEREPVVEAVALPDPAAEPGPAVAPAVPDGAAGAGRTAEDAVAVPVTAGPEGGRFADVVRIATSQSRKDDSAQTVEFQMIFRCDPATAGDVFPAFTVDLLAALQRAARM